MRFHIAPHSGYTLLKRSAPSWPANWSSMEAPRLGHLDLQSYTLQGCPDMSSTVLINLTTPGLGPEVIPPIALVSVSLLSSWLICHPHTASRHPVLLGVGRSCSAAASVTHNQRQRGSDSVSFSGLLLPQLKRESSCHSASCLVCIPSSRLQKPAT